MSSLGTEKPHFGAFVPPFPPSSSVLKITLPTHSNTTTPLESPEPLSSRASTKTDPSSYFPSSRRSSISSSSSISPDFEVTRQTLADTGRANTAPVIGSAQMQNPVEVLSRIFPKPVGQPTTEELLARPPQKWSLSYYLKNAREAKVLVPDKEESAKAFAETKRELLRASTEFKNQGAGRP